MGASSAKEFWERHRIYEKSAGKDAAAEKATYPAVIGIEASRSEARRLTRKAQAAVKAFGEEAEPLREIGNYLLAREY